ncbi:NUDIX hydrolase [Maribacter cobaltidurans]|uniref:Hydrolase n=1 Tax=Maribacter cobaltidurans TaxID=1178778 RepID=A0A223V9D4_9FLAO|nr:NUDIX domain-containing protein [Maribacter cobaltidurans]ASV31936.1 hydrolase [Maribacter cobaltidurans]GGD85837.1 DNA mismatch repair protein MutT [Maribacter cobaltidurans]
MDELVDILDEEGKYKGISLMKSQAHQKGLFHPTVHVWFYTPNGQILIQQRGKDKDTYPLLWDVSVAGHVGAGENIKISAVREIEEEIGLKIKPSDLHKIGIFKSVQKHSESLIDCEFHHTFLVELRVSLENLTKQESEVEDLKLVSITQFEEELGNEEKSKKYVPHSSDYYKTILAEVKKLA